MRKGSLLVLVFISCCRIVTAQDNATLLTDLNRTIRDKALYTKQKEDRIDSIKARLNTAPSLPERFRLNRLLYLENQKFRIDSALFYANQNVAIAKSLDRPDLLTAARLDLANVYLPLNQFLEANEILKTIDPKQLSKAELPDYYKTRIQFLGHYIINGDEAGYKELLGSYRDSLLLVLDPKSADYQYTLAARYIYAGQLAAGEDYMLRELATIPPNSPEYAMLTWYLGIDYEMQHNNASAIHYYALSAAADVRLSIKDNAAMQALALLLYSLNDIDHAYAYTQSALEDAWFCDSRFRNIHMSKFYSIINKAYLKKEAARKGQLQFYLLLISLLSVFLGAGVIYIYRQMKRESRMRTELNVQTRQLAELNTAISNSNLRLNEANSRLSETNNQLNETNSLLSESNRIKEVYIARFFDLCSSYINKLENFQDLVNKKAADKHVDELQKMLRSNNMVKAEVEELYKIFDNIFLTLYPTFVDDFNALLAPEKQTILKHGELLNTELRVYALIRLGITDSTEIAAFLRYSLSTIYNCRTSARNKAAVSRHSFEEEVRKIGAIAVG